MGPCEFIPKMTEKKYITLNIFLFFFHFTYTWQGVEKLIFLLFTAMELSSTIEAAILGWKYIVPTLAMKIESSSSFSYFVSMNLGRMWLPFWGSIPAFCDPWIMSLIWVLDWSS